MEICLEPSEMLLLNQMDTSNEPIPLFCFREDHFVQEEA